VKQTDYYLVLGVSQSETPAGIRSAFRQLVRRYHPDRAGPGSRGVFERVVEAYSVLSDGERRAAYDRGLYHREAEPLIPTAPITPRPRSRQVAPLVPGRLSLLHDFEVTRPSFDEVFQRFFDSFRHEAPRPRRLPEPLRLVVAVSRHQALRGGGLTLGVPVFYPCTECLGSGWTGPVSCGGCDGRGMITEEEPLRVHLPAGVADGTVFQLPLRALGIHDMYLELQVRVAG